MVLCHHEIEVSSVFLYLKHIQAKNLVMNVFSTWIHICHSLESAVIMSDDYRSETILESRANVKRSIVVANSPDIYPACPKNNLIEMSKNGNVLATAPIIST